MADTDFDSVIQFGVAVLAALIITLTLLVTAARADYAAGEAAYFAGDYTKAYNEWLPLARQGNAAAQHGLGSIYDNGLGVAQDPSEAVRWFRRAADQGLATAQASLGLMYALGRGVSPNYDEAMRLFGKAAEQQDARAQFLLGVMYSEATGVPQDDDLALRWFRRAADQGHLVAQVRVGLMYENGRGVAKDDAEALRWYRKAADQGDAGARTALARLQEQMGAEETARQATRKNDTEETARRSADRVAAAVAAYTEAVTSRDFDEVLAELTPFARRGNADAQNVIGDMLERGVGLPRNDREAARWFRYAAEQGLARAQNSLGQMYHEGRGVPQDFAAAARWFRKAADQGFAHAAFRLGLLFEGGNGVARDIAAAANWYRVAAEGDLDSYTANTVRIRLDYTEHLLGVAEEARPKEERKRPKSERPAALGKIEGRTRRPAPRREEPETTRSTNSNCAGASGATLTLKNELAAAQYSDPHSISFYVAVVSPRNAFMCVTRFETPLGSVTCLTSGLFSMNGGPLLVTTLEPGTCLGAIPQRSYLRAR